MGAGAFLEEYRQKHALSYLALAHLVDYDPGNMWRLCTQDRINIRSQTALRFAKRLGVTMEVLLTEQGAPPGCNEIGSN